MGGCAPAPLASVSSPLTVTGAACTAGCRVAVLQLRCGCAGAALLTCDSTLMAPWRAFSSQNSTVLLRSQESGETCATIAGILKTG
jgi:hypothetical protein